MSLGSSSSGPPMAEGADESARRWAEVLKRGPDVGGSEQSSIGDREAEYRASMHRPDEVVELDLRERLRKFLSDSKPFIDASAADWADAKEHVRKISGHVHVRWFDQVLWRSQYSDRQIADDILEGFPLVGATPETGQFESKDSSDEWGDLLGEEDLWRFAKFKDAKPTWQDGDLLEFGWQSAKEEVEKGWAVECAPGYVPECVNYGHSVRQPQEEDPDKKRYVVFYRAVNAVSRISEKIRLPTHRELLTALVYFVGGADVSTLVESASDIAKIMKSCADADKSIPLAQAESPRSAASTWADRVPHARRKQWGILKRDFKSAYKQMACRNLDHNVMGTWDPKSNRWRHFHLYYMAFGSYWAVASWMRIAKAIEHVLWAEFKIYCRIYVDDVIIFAPEALLGVVGEVVDRVIESFGFRMSAQKDEQGREVKVLGVLYSVGVDSVSTDITLQRRSKICNLLKGAIGALENSNLSKKDLQKVTGTVQFAIIANRFSVLRAVCQPLYSAIASASDGERIQRSAELINALWEVLKCVQRAPRFSLSTDPAKHKPAFLYTDAAASKKSKRICAVLVKDGKIFFCDREMRESEVRTIEDRRGNAINYLESITVSWAFEVLGAELRDRKVFLFVDNSSALYSVWKGTSLDIMMRLAAQSAYRISQAHGALLSMRWIPSKWNPADGRTREDLFKLFSEAIALTGLRSAHVVAPSSSDVIDAYMREIREKVK